MPDETDATPGTTEGAGERTESDAQRNERGEREQGVRSERSDDLSSPQFTVHGEDLEGR